MNISDWKIEYKRPRLPQELLDAGYSPLLSAMLGLRNIETAAQAASFLSGGEGDLPDPFLMLDMDKAADRLRRAIADGETVAVYGDYDVDGITATCLLTDWLRNQGLDVVPYIPDRIEEGYGLNSAAIDHLKGLGVTLIVTVDCGITAVDEAAYAASLGIDMYKPVPGRFKDYISTPKPNMYQSVHTTVIGSEGIPFEVQIRTWEMHRTAEYGVAAHWKYKMGNPSAVEEGDEESYAWVRRLLESQQDSDASDFFHNLKIDMFADEVFVFSPKGDVINLPAGATPIDFAYSIHSGVGNSMVGASVNGRIVTFDHVLQNGDIVEIRTSKSAPGPSRDWLNMAKSGSARTKIKQWFKKERREDNITTGRDMFEAEIRSQGLSADAFTDEEFLPQLLKRVSFSTLEDLYAAIGYGGITATKAVNRMQSI